MTMNILISASRIDLVAKLMKFMVPLKVYPFWRLIIDHYADLVYKHELAVMSAAFSQQSISRVTNSERNNEALSTGEEADKLKYYPILRTILEQSNSHYENARSSIVQTANAVQPNSDSVDTNTYIYASEPFRPSAQFGTSSSSSSSMSGVGTISQQQQEESEYIAEGNLSCTPLAPPMVYDLGGINEDDNDNSGGRTMLKQQNIVLDLLFE